MAISAGRHPKSAPSRQSALDRHRTSGPSRGSERGLDWFVFCLADLQTGFGPFLAVYLTTRKWTQGDIGLVLSIGSLVALLAQLPGGWLVDAVSSKRRIAMLGVAGIGASALVMASWPVFAAILVAKMLHVVASAVLGPAVAAITLGLVGHADASRRFGRNARFAAIGNGLAAGFMGAVGHFISPQAVFLVTAALAVPTLVALLAIHEDEVDSMRAAGGIADAEVVAGRTGLARLLARRGFIVFALLIMTFHFANTAMLPIVAGAMTVRSAQWASALVAACIVLPQLTTAILSPTVAQAAQSWGRRPVLLVGFVMLPARGLVLAWTNDPLVIVAVQVLDGVSAAALGVLVPLILADLARGTGRYNLAQGIIGCATGIGAILSTAVAGHLADRYGTGAAFLCLSGAAVAAVLLLALLMPETKRLSDG